MRGHGATTSDITRHGGSNGFWRLPDPLEGGRGGYQRAATLEAHDPKAGGKADC